MLVIAQVFGAWRIESTVIIRITARDPSENIALVAAIATRNVNSLVDRDCALHSLNIYTVSPNTSRLAVSCLELPSCVI